MTAHSYEKSCGALVFRREAGEIYLLMIRHKAGGHRSFPKGHMEAGEDEHATAIRERVDDHGGGQPAEEGARRRRQVRRG